MNRTVDNHLANLLPTKPTSRKSTTTTIIMMTITTIKSIKTRMWEGKGGNNISKEVWTLQAQSLTPPGE